MVESIRKQRSRRMTAGGQIRTRVRAALCAVIVLCTASVFAQTGAAATNELPAELAATWRATKLPLSAMSLAVREVDGPQLIDINGGQVRNPASVMKMVTTWTALAGLGPEYRWRTTLLAKGPLRVDAQGSLQGPLYIKASGDPFLTVPELWELLRQLRLRGIKNLSEVVVDRTVFGNVTINPADFDGAADRPYNASPDAMMVGLGAVQLLFQPDMQAEKWIPVLDPPMPGVRIEGEVAWSTARCTGSPSVATSPAADERGVVIRVSGRAAASCGEFSVYRMATTQSEYFSALFRMLWRELGGTLGKGISAGRVPAGAVPMVWTDSETLADTARQINKQSNNVMARALLLTLGAEKQGPGATPATGAQAALAILNDQGVDTQGWVIDNGAGLSRHSRLTANGLSTMLDVAWRSPLMPEFMSSLAISGVDGTVRRRLRDDEVRGMAHLKTGTLRDTSAVAGYVLSATGKRYVVVNLINHDNPTAARPFFDALIRWLAAR